MRKLTTLPCYQFRNVRKYSYFEIYIREASPPSALGSEAGYGLVTSAYNGSNFTGVQLVLCLERNISANCPTYYNRRKS